MFKLNTKVLVVDDMLTMRKMVKKNLGVLGYTQFEEAEDGEKAWGKLIAIADVGLIISDWNMPNLTGLDFLKRVRADARYAKLPFLLLTAEGEVAQIKEAVQADVDGYILKPFNLDSLSEKMRQAFNKRSNAA